MEVRQLRWVAVALKCVVLAGVLNGCKAEQSSSTEPTGPAITHARGWRVLTHTVSASDIVVCFHPLDDGGLNLGHARILDGVAHTFRGSATTFLKREPLLLNGQPIPTIEEEGSVFGWDGLLPKPCS